ncbi:MAG: T9SS type A sorting domain-containing protein [Flavobacteriaceae bacterium]|nr:T9SS type A sorting domain-containing protein [Flavobacteriaceae bacterium]
MKKTLPSLLLLIGLVFNINSQTTFSLAQTVSLSGSADPYAIATGDLDGDGNNDILFASSGNGTFSWLKNDGTGNFITPATTIGSGGYGYPNSVAIADVDGINGNDVILCAGDQVIWFPNDGSGNFATENSVASFPSFGASFIVVKDINGDSTLDIAVSDYYTHQLVWVSNSGTAPHFNGTKNTIASSFTNVAGFDLGDIDGDGDIDAVISNAIGISASPNDSKIEVYYNDGSEVFTADANPVANNTKDYMWSVLIADVDGDTDMDILATDLFGNVSWYNRAGVIDGPATYSETPFTTSIANPATIAFEDLDNDTLKDVVLSSGLGSGNAIVWFKNNGSGTFASETIIDATQANTYTMALSDFDDDGDIDITSAAYGNDTIKIFDNEKINLSVDESLIDKFNIFPNPTKNTLNFKVPFAESFKVSVYDILGKEVLHSTLQNSKSLDVSKLNNGIYILKFDDYNTNLKFVKK